MKFKLNKKIVLPFASLALISTPVAVAVSCGNNEKTAEQNQKDTILASGSDYLLRLYTGFINKDLMQDETKHQESLEAAWNFWASSKLMEDKWFWTKEIVTLQKSGTFSKADFTDKKVWVNAKDDTEVTLKASENVVPGFYPSWTLAQEILKQKPTLNWELELENLILVQNYLTGFVESDYKKVYKKEEDEPKNLDRNEKFFFLIKYLHEHTPTFIWKQSVKGLKAGAISGETVKTAAEFNDLDPRSHDLMKLGLVKADQLKTSNDNTLTVDLGELYNYKGISSAGISKGELDYSDYALRKRLTDNTSESGWVTKEGDIEKEAHVIVNDDGSVDSMFAMQFLPWFDAKDEDNKQVTDKDKVYTIDDDKSFWRIDSSLLKNPKVTDKNKRNITENAQKLIFSLAQHDSSLLNDARKFMLNIRKYNLRVNNGELRNILKGKDVIKK
ncbi:HinT-interacting membrane complex lipoprotein P60 [Mycoplasma todarodis]|uniref:HinT-interacting membrane complex lipoprotein P60 n=1 Tax=Mycoplasma todarodis TaxID=1937191 RepID=UPI003B37CFC3